MTCPACQNPLSRNHFARGGVRVCSRTCAMRSGGDGWQMVTLPDLIVKPLPGDRHINQELDRRSGRNQQQNEYRKRKRAKALAAGEA